MTAKTIAIARREFRALFDSPVAYIVIVAFLLVTGWMFFSTLFLRERADLRVLFTPSLFSPAMLLLIFAPAISMRAVAEERKSGTIELLTSMPVRDWEVVLGKFLADFALTAAAVLSTLVYAITVACIGDLDWGPVISGYLGMLLFAASLLAIGLMCSSWTDNQIVAFIVALLIGACLYVISWLQFFVPDFIAPLVDYVSLSSHLSNMARGVLDTRDLLYYFTLIGGALFIAERSMAHQHA
ncbi:MAG: ABC transporter permease [Deltaproteobacteria bacterium]|nr:ABC transporter permease [Deltaproteobacteria bacterium]